MKSYHIFLYSSFSLLLSCSSTLNITSSVPARIEAGGQFFCETPCTIDTTNMAFNLDMEAFPLDKSLGVKQSKRVHNAENSENIVYFDMGSAPGIQIIKNTEQNTSPPLKEISKAEDNKEKELMFLKKMFEKGAITNEVYNEQIKKILNK